MIPPPAPDTQAKVIAPELLGLGAPITARDAPRLLIRYPGACGVRDHFNETLKNLAHPDQPISHFTTELIPYIREGARRFGIFVIPNPTGEIPLVKASGEEPVYLTMNTPLIRDQDYCWIPARLLPELQERKSVENVSEILHEFGDEILEAKISSRFELEDYFREVGGVISSGIALPVERWHELPERRRREILRGIGAEPVWTIQAAKRLGLE